jgi:hypothetical protein
MASATTRTTTAATDSQLQRSSLVIVVLSVRWASQATTSSKSLVWRAPGRAQGTASVRTRPQRLQDRRRISASRYSLVVPRSRWRHRRRERS